MLLQQCCTATTAHCALQRPPYLSDKKRLSAGNQGEMPGAFSTWRRHLAYLISERAGRPAVVEALAAPLARLQKSLRDYRRKRAIYLRTLRELQSYQPHELTDLQIHASDFPELARKQAGW